MSSLKKIRVVTRKSRLARAQTDEAVAYLSPYWPEVEWEIIPMSTQGDQRLNWSLAKTGGKGLFTSELERAIVAGEADLAVHSAKDLPTEMTPGLTLAGYLPRANPADVLICRVEVEVPQHIATSSPRRRAQLMRRFPDAQWSEIRGNVQTRLEKIADGEADATLLAAAGLERLGIKEFPGLRFEVLEPDCCIPAAGQGAIGLQVREADAPLYEDLLCAETRRCVEIERAELEKMGGGCHSACAAYYDGKQLRIFREESQ